MIQLFVIIVYILLSADSTESLTKRHLKDDGDSASREPGTLLNAPCKIHILFHRKDTLPDHLGLELSCDNVVED